MVTAGSLLGRFGSDVLRVAEMFVRDKLATLVVSDAHDLTDRAPLLPEGLEAAKRLGKLDQEDEQRLVS